MYAPKFRSWISSEERFSEALDYRLSVAAEDAMREIKEMVSSFKTNLPEPKSNVSDKDVQHWANEAYLRQLAASPYPNIQYQQFGWIGALFGFHSRDNGGWHF